MGHPYQERGLSFCCERLGSWLLMRHLEIRYGRPFASREFEENASRIGNVPIPSYADIFSYPEMFGYMHCVESSII
jgi:hypothetical protein